MEQEDIILSTLRKHYQDREWFGEVGYDQFGRPVLYIKHECHETIWTIPDRWEGKQLMVHFLASHTARADNFLDKPQETNGHSTLTINVGDFMKSAKEAQAKGIDTGFVGASGEEADAVFTKLKLDKTAQQARAQRLQTLIDAQTDPNAPKFTPLSPREMTDLAASEEEERQLELSVRALTDELDRLERLCGSNILQDIFYEVHDKTNAVTNLSAKFPEVRGRVEKLYDKYGFDIIYEELDG